MVLMVVLFPAVLVTSWIVSLFGLLWRKKDGTEVTITEEEFENILDTAEDEGIIDESETELLQSALEFTDMDAGDILTPSHLCSSGHVPLGSRSTLFVQDFRLRPIALYCVS